MLEAQMVGMRWKAGDPQAELPCLIDDLLLNTTRRRSGEVIVRCK